MACPQNVEWMYPVTYQASQEGEETEVSYIYYVQSYFQSYYIEFIQSLLMLLSICVINDLLAF